jgi:hypothetical protein
MTSEMEKAMPPDCWSAVVVQQINYIIALPLPDCIQCNYIFALPLPTSEQLTMVGVAFLFLKSTFGLYTSFICVHFHIFSFL